MKLLIIIAIAVFSSVLPAKSQDHNTAAIAEGKRLATINCTRCHNIEATGESPLTDAPPFREIARNYDYYELVDGFMEGLAVRHPLMPDWDVTEPQAEQLAAFVLSLGSGEKQDETLAGEGYDLLQVNCARCHAIEAAGDSPEPKAPPFRDVVKKYDPQALEEALAEGIVTGHEQMPQFTFAPDQVTAIVAYLDTLN